MFLKGLLRKFVIKVGGLIENGNDDIASATLPKFRNKPKNLMISLPRRLYNSEHISLGDNISLGPGSLLLALTHYPTITMKHPEKHQDIQQFTPKISLGDRVTSTATLQISAVKEISIEDDVMFASNINITDCSHGYENADQPYKYQKLFKIAPVCIKKGCWIAQNVVILPGVTIGEHTIVGANSVVTDNLPDKCIAVGAPAKVIKKWDKTVDKWITVS